MDDNLLPLEHEPHVTDWDAAEFAEHQDHVAETAADSLYRHGDVTPDWKPAKREKASRKGWEGLRGRFANARCAVCGDPAESLHHIVRKSQGGSDVHSNLLAVCGDGARGCHGLIERRVGHALSSVRQALTYAQLSYVLSVKNEAWLERAYPLPRCVTCCDAGCTACEVAA